MAVALMANNTETVATRRGGGNGTSSTGNNGGSPGGSVRANEAADFGNEASTGNMSIIYYLH